MATAPTTMPRSQAYQPDTRADAATGPALRRVLISVTDKRGLAEVAAALDSQGVEIVSTGGTAEHIRAAGVEVTDVNRVTGFAAMLDGRVKTLHPAVHAGIAARAGDARHDAELAAHGVERFDAVIVNLYRFDAHPAHAQSNIHDALDQIDIGGPAMLRAAARNFPAVLAIVDPDDYHLLDTPANLDEAMRLHLAAKCFRHVASYDASIAEYLTAMAGDENPETLTVVLECGTTLRYGDNPHQPARLYRRRGAAGGIIHDLTQVTGAGLSYTNILDIECASRVLGGRHAPTCVALKHASPCSVATATDIPAAIDACRTGDPVSIFGGVVALNRRLDMAAATELLPTFLEAIVAPVVDEDAVNVLAGRWPRLRILAGTAIADPPPPIPPGEIRISGNTALVQDANVPGLVPERRDIVSARRPDAAELEALEHAWSVAAHVPSNAIVLATGTKTVGIGGGQPNRVDAARIAIQRAGGSARGAVLASDGFIPMADTVEVAACAGITAIIQPGGSRADADVREVVDSHGIAMVYTATRHFRH